MPFEALHNLLSGSPHAAEHGVLSVVPGTPTLVSEPLEDLCAAPVWRCNVEFGIVEQKTASSEDGTGLSGHDPQISVPGDAQQELEIAAETYGEKNQGSSEGNSLNKGVCVSSGP